MGMTTTERIAAQLANRNLTTDDVQMARAAAFVDDMETYDGMTLTSAADWDYIINNHSTSGLVIC